MDSIASFTIDTGGQKYRDAISKQHGDVMLFSCHSEKMLWNHLYACLSSCKESHCLVLQDELKARICAQTIKHLAGSMESIILSDKVSVLSME